MQPLRVEMEWYKLVQFFMQLSLQKYLSIVGKKDDKYTDKSQFVRKCEKYKK